MDDLSIAQLVARGSKAIDQMRAEIDLVLGIVIRGLVEDRPQGDDWNLSFSFNHGDLVWKVDYHGGGLLKGECKCDITCLGGAPATLALGFWSANHRGKSHKYLEVSHERVPEVYESFQRFVDALFHQQYPELKEVFDPLLKAAKMVR